MNGKRHVKNNSSVKLLPYLLQNKENVEKISIDTCKLNCRIEPNSLNSDDEMRLQSTQQEEVK